MTTKNVRLNAHPAHCLSCNAKRSAGHGELLRAPSGAWVTDCHVKTEAPAAKDAFTPSTYQAAVRAALETTQTHLVIGAVAGSGKTTTIDWLMRELQPILGKVIYLVFNKALKEAAERKVPSSVTVRTLNSFGLAQCVKNLGRDRLQDPDDNKMRTLAREMFPVENHPHAEAHKLLQAPLVALAKLERATLLGNPQRLAERHGVDLGDADLGLLWDAVPALVKRAHEVAINAGYVDYDDQVYLPAVETGWTIEQFDTVFVDEDQDLNEAQLRMVLKAAGRTGRVVAVGDRYQAIYGFRGAGITAFDDVFASLRATSRGAVELPLSVCYRCPQVIADLVNDEGLLVDEAGKRTVFLAREGAPVGVIEHLHEDKLVGSLLQDVKALGGKVEQEKLLVLCPRNAPLVRPCLRLLVAGIKATIRGKDIGQEIVRLILRVNPGSSVRSQRDYKVGNEDVTVLLKALKQHVHREVEKLMKAEKEAAAEKLRDQAECIEAFAEDAEKVSSIVRAIEGVFTEADGEGVIFSTVHRTKGGQADTVYLMEEWLMPFPSAKQAWERRQGLNLRYVALTRAQQRLVFVYDSKHAPDDDGDEEPTEQDESREDFSDHDDKDAREGEEATDYQNSEMARRLEEAEAEAEMHPEASNVDLDKALLAEVLKKLPILPTEGEKKGFVEPTMTDWNHLLDLYTKAGCEALLHKPQGAYPWRQYAFDVTLPGVTVRCSTTVEGFGVARESGKNAIDVCVVDKTGRPVDGKTKVLRTDAWQGRVCQRVNALLKKHARIQTPEAK